MMTQTTLVNIHPTQALHPQRIPLVKRVCEMASMAYSSIMIGVMAVSLYILMRRTVTAYPDQFTEDVILSKSTIGRKFFALDMEFLPDNSGRFLLLSKEGQIKICNPSDVQVPCETYLDLRQQVYNKDEVGMLAMKCDLKEHWSTENAKIWVYWSKKDYADETTGAFVPRSMRLSTFSHVEAPGTDARANAATQHTVWIDSDGLPGVDNAQYNSKGVRRLHQQEYMLTLYD